MASFAYAGTQFIGIREMSIRGPKPSYLTLVDAADAIEDDLKGKCGAKTGRGKPCGRTAGWGTDHPGDGRCRDHAEAPVASSCPLPLTGLQAELWSDLTDRLRSIGIMKDVFWPTIYGLTVALALMHDAVSSIDQTVVRGDNGADKKHPGTTIVNQMLSQVRSYCAELGITPSALAKIGFEPSKTQSKLDRLITGG